MNSQVLLSLGSNTDDPRKQLRMAIDQLGNIPDTVIVKCSSIYDTSAWGKTDQPNFLNMAVILTTSQTVVGLMQNILSIEENMGRERIEKWGPRCIDIDIVLFGETIHKDEFVTVPHPHVQDRRFVLEPSREIASTMIHPIFGKTIEELFAICPDTSVPLLIE